METTRQQVGRILAEEYNVLGPVVDARGDVIEPDSTECVHESEWDAHGYGAYCRKCGETLA